MLKSSLWFPRVQWQIFQIQQLCSHTQYTVLYLCVMGGTNFSFIDEWREYISQVFIFAFEIYLVKFAKIKTPQKFLLIQYLKQLSQYMTKWCFNNVIDTPVAAVCPWLISWLIHLINTDVISCCYSYESGRISLVGCRTHSVDEWDQTGTISCGNRKVQTQFINLVMLLRIGEGEGSGRILFVGCRTVLSNEWNRVRITPRPLKFLPQCPLTWPIVWLPSTRE